VIGLPLPAFQNLDRRTEPWGMAVHNLKSIAAGMCLAIAATGFSAGSAQAALISSNDGVFGVNSITQDTATGLEWLDVNLSTAMPLP
jgi:hypothetical protein